MTNRNVENAVAGFDASGSQYLAVKSTPETDDERVLLAVSDADVNTMGFLQNAPDDDGLAKVAVSGYCTAIAGAVIRPYAQCMVDGSGRVIEATTGKVVVCIYYPPLKGLVATGRDSATGQEIRIWALADKHNLRA